LLGHPGNAHLPERDLRVTQFASGYLLTSPLIFQRQPDSMPSAGLGPAAAWLNGADRKGPPRRVVVSFACVGSTLYTAKRSVGIIAAARWAVQEG
jgi:hypothetical protein